MSEPRTNLEIWRDALQLLQEREFDNGYNFQREKSYVSCESCHAAAYGDNPPEHNPGCRLVSALRELAAFVAVEERLEEERAGQPSPPERP